MPDHTRENDDRLAPITYALERPTNLLSERGRARGTRPLPGDLIRALARELPLYRRHARRTLQAQAQRSAFAIYRRQVEILRDRIRARKRNAILYSKTDFERQLNAVREFRQRFETLVQDQETLVAATSRPWWALFALPARGVPAQSQAPLDQAA